MPDQVSDERIIIVLRKEILREAVVIHSIEYGMQSDEALPITREYLLHFLSICEKHLYFYHISFLPNSRVILFIIVINLHLQVHPFPFAFDKTRFVRVHLFGQEVKVNSCQVGVVVGYQVVEHDNGKG
jgi:hypothetical protein